ncbi:unnamed protein product [Trichobilharzia szidati]|nr:unnamed protein product [Trichobilharzia szidati]
MIVEIILIMTIISCLRITIAKFCVSFCKISLFIFYLSISQGNSIHPFSGKTLWSMCILNFIYLMLSRYF